MIKDSIAFIANYFWRESILNIGNHLNTSELKTFSSNDYYYLTTIYYMGNPNFSQLADKLKLTKPAISAIIRKLSGMGLIEKKQSTEDKRVFFIGITDKGRNIIEGDEKLYIGIEELIKHLSGTKEQYEFVEILLEKLTKTIETR